MSGFQHDDRVMVLDHPRWQGGKLWGYEGVIVINFKWWLAGHHAVRFPWLKKTVYLPDRCLCPIYNDCEECGYAAWGAINDGTDKQEDYHHYCAWCLPKQRELRVTSDE